MIEAGAAGVHFEDQLASVKKCGHMGGKVLVPTQEAVQKLIAARLAADIMGDDRALARTDAEAADIVTSDIDENDKPFLTGERTSEGFYKTRKGFDQALARGIAYAEYADMVWCETGTPDLAFAKKFAEGIRRKHPDKMLAYNCSPSFNWKRNLDDATIAKFQRELGAMGYKFQFITLAGFHSLNYSMFELAHGYARSGMSAFVELQQEFAAAEKGFTAVKHQREVGTGYFDEITQVVTKGVHHGAARLDRGRAILRLAEKAEARRGVDFAARIARTILDGFDRHYGLFRQAALEARRLFERPPGATCRRSRASASRCTTRASKKRCARWPTASPRPRSTSRCGRPSRLPTSACCTITSSRSAPRRSTTRSRARCCTGATTATSSSSGARRSPPSTSRARRRATAASTAQRRIALAFLDRQELGARQPVGGSAARCAQRGARAARAFPEAARAQPDLQIQVLASLFFRNKAAYIIGRVINAHRELPFAVPILQNERGDLYLDTLLVGEDQLLVLFSFARAYFFVDMEVPAAYISFLRWLMPRKPRASFTCQWAWPSRARRSSIATCITT